MSVLLRVVIFAVLALAVTGCASWSWPTWTNPFAKKPVDMNSPGVAVTLGSERGRDGASGVPPDVRRQEQESSALAERAAKQATATQSGGAVSTPLPNNGAPAGASAAEGSAASSGGGGAPPAPARPTPPKPNEDVTAMVGEPKGASPAAGVPPAPGAAIEKISLQGDALFEYGKHDAAGMLPAGKKKLDELAGHIKAMDPAAIGAIAVVGHADRLGRSESKLRVSQQRAETVAHYLIAKGIDPNLVQSSGKGDAQPVAKCEGKKPTPKLVACLAPNRRVEVVIKGQ
jgi:outer membrane protein OmpA-like peptidoglycan-associated protein